MTAYTIGTLLFIVILNVCFGLFRFPFINVSPFEAIPKNSAFIFEPNPTHNVFSSSFINDSDFSIFRQLAEDRKLLIPFLKDSTFNSNNLKTLIAPQMIGEAKIDFLYIIDVRNVDLNTDFFNSQEDAFKIKKFKYSGAQYKSIKLENHTPFYFYNYRNLILVSKTPVLIEEGIRQIFNYSDNITFETDFKEVSKRKNLNNNSRVYIHFKKLPKYLSSFFKYEHRNILDALPNFVNWLSLDFSDLASLKMNGCFTDAQLFEKTKGNFNIREMSLLETIPDHAGFLFAQHGLNLNGGNDSTFTRFVEPWFDGDWAFTVVNAHSSADRLLFIKAKSVEIANHYLEKYGDEYGVLVAATYQTFPIKQLVDYNLLKPFVNDLKIDLENPYFTILEGSVVFGKSRQSLEILIDKYIVGQTIVSNERFLNFMNNLSDRTNSFLYYDEKALMYILEKLVVKNNYLTFDQVQSSSKDFKNGGFEFCRGDKTVPFRSIFKKSELNENRTNIVWRVALPANIRYSPKPLWNPLTNAYEIAIQDDLHNFYMLNNNGEILWKRALKEPLLSEIHLIDYQENGSLKLLFNTSHNIYLLDRDGKNIGNYPLHLQSPATNGLCVIDFKHNRQYQLFLACENGHAYGFSKEGNPVFGWNPNTDVGRILQPFQHFQNEDKDFIILLNDKGDLITCNSEGKRVYPKIDLGNSFQNRREVLSVGTKKVATLANFKDKTKLKEHFEMILKYEQDEIFEIKAPDKAYSYYGTVSKAKKQIHLFNAQNVLYEGFPLAGTTSFSIVDLYDSNNNILIVGFDNSVYAYRILNSK